MTEPNKAFREYATRVSFNISLSRNQIWTLYQISLGRYNMNMNDAAINEVLK